MATKLANLGHLKKLFKTEGLLKLGKYLVLFFILLILGKITLFH